MYKVIKNKGNIIKAYQLGTDSPVLRTLIEDGKICDIENDRYEIHSRETANGESGGQIAVTGDWIKIDSSGFPYPNSREFFEANHRHIEGDRFEQLPKPLPAWDAKLEMCPEVAFLVEERRLIINENSFEQRYSAELWGTNETAAEDAMIVFYSISYDDEGKVIDAEYNFVERQEFEKTYSVL